MKFYIDMNLSRTLWAILGACFFTLAAHAQNKTISFRFATRAEAQMLITDIDQYTNGWNQFDINSRLQKENGRKSELLRLAMNETKNWSDQDKAKVTQAMKSIEGQIKKQKFNINFPEEIVFVKTSMKEEGNAGAYTRKNWIALGEQSLSEASDEELKMLLAHEIFHVLTRNDLAFKKAMYQTIGFTVMNREILFPSDIMEKRISNPDIDRYDSYATFTINGTKQNCTMMIYTERPYEGGTFADYIKIGLIPLNEQFSPIQQNGTTVIYGIEDAEDFYTQIGKNTTYVINPEETLADNFSYAIMEKKDLPNPEIIEKMCSLLKEKR